MFGSLAARLSSSRVERCFLTAVALLVAALGVRAGLRAADNRSAFTRWQPQLLLVGTGADLSAEHNYPNPPIMAVLLEPLSRLPRVPGALLWYSLKAAMAVVSLMWVLRLVESDEQRFPPGGASRPEGCHGCVSRETEHLDAAGVTSNTAGTAVAHPGMEQRFPRWARMLVVLCSLKPILDDLAHGNVNLFVLFLVVAALTAYRGRCDLLAGVILALAIACKVTPALFVPYFLWKRSWRVLAGCVVGLGLFLWPGVVPSMRLGMKENSRHLASWYRVMVYPFVVEGRVTSEHLNQSLPGVVARLATRQPSFIGWRGDVQTAVRYDNLLELPPDTARRLVQGCLLLFAAVVVWVCRAPGEVRGGWRVSAELALVLVGMLLFSERTWKHHAVTLVLPVAVLVYGLACCRLSGSSRIGVTVVLAVAVVLLTIPGLDVGGTKRLDSGVAPSVAKMAQVYGVCTWAFVLLAGGLVVLLQSSPPLQGGSSVPSTASERRATLPTGIPLLPALSSTTAHRTDPDGTLPWPPHLLAGTASRGAASSSAQSRG